MELALRDPERTWRAGVVALLVLLALAVLLFALRRASAHDGVPATVYFRHTGDLREGADVQVAGRVIGRVVAISLVSAHAAKLGHALHPDGGVAVSLRVDRGLRHMAPRNGELFISNKGVLGERFIEIGPPPGNGPRARPIEPGDELRGIDPPEIDRMLLRAYRNIENARHFARALRPELDELADALGALAVTLHGLDAGDAARATRAAVARLVDEIRALDAALRAGGASVGDVQRLWAAARATAARVQAAADELGVHAQLLREHLAHVAARMPADVPERLAAALADIQAALARAERAAAAAGELLARVRAGEGTVGALLFDPEFPEHAKELGRFLKRNPWRLVGRPARP